MVALELDRLNYLLEKTGTDDTENDEKVYSSFNLFIKKLIQTLKEVQCDSNDRETFSALSILIFIN
jgi:hypothetical protein